MPSFFPGLKGNLIAPQTLELGASISTTFHLDAHEDPVAVAMKTPAGRVQISADGNVRARIVPTSAEGDPSTIVYVAIGATPENPAVQSFDLTAGEFRLELENNDQRRTQIFATLARIC
jgi:hypothetical protein